MSLKTSFSQKEVLYAVDVAVADSVGRKPLFLATVALVRDGRQFKAGTCDVSGKCTIRNIPGGRYELHVSFVGYRSHVSTLYIDRHISKTVLLASQAVRMQEVVVTARESKGMTSSSVINRRAMEHLQPSSFTDLLELLPGGRSKDPSLTKMNPIRLREAGDGVSDPDYDISSRGIAFMINGTPINNGADMMQVSGEDYSDERNRTTVGRGVDMRMISTDAIEKVEIVRGIPSVEYGSLTSGLVNIRRKAGGNRLHARFKADGSSKLVYVGKGFELPSRNIKLNADIDWLDAKADPRDNLENYKRLTLSFRLQKVWENSRDRVRYSSDLDYSGSFNTDEVDPDINSGRSDSYKSRVNRVSMINNVEWKSKRGKSFFRSLAFHSSVSYSKDEIKDRKFCQLNRPLAAPVSKEEGEHDAVYMPFKYVGHQNVDNRPFGANVRLTALFHLDQDRISQDIKAGADWKMDKNYGKGQIYDPLSAIHYNSIFTRPRPYSDVPAGHDLSFFAEDLISLRLSSHTLELQGGIRANTLLNLPSDYKLHGRFHFDPRFNARWIFPEIPLQNNILQFELGGGLGWHTMAPTLMQLYPEKLYYDIIQLNYFHTNPDYRRMQIVTYIVDPVNPDLSVARNFKWEMRGNVSYDGNGLSVTLFKEKMTSGFRNGTSLKPMAYKVYDNSSIDPEGLQGPPDPADMSFQRDTLMQVYRKPGNGTHLEKSGVEFQFASKRFPLLATRITVNGAYFKTTYSNSEGYYQAPTDIVDNRRIPYVGWYDDKDGYVRRSFHTNFMFDTYIKKLRLGFSLAAQCLWLNDRRNEHYDGIPEYYVDKSGMKHPFTEDSADDMLLRFLLQPPGDQAFRRSKVEGFNLNVNLKVTKRLYEDRIHMALFVNRLVSCQPDYTSNGKRIRQIGRTPYFGMEINFNI